MEVLHSKLARKAVFGAVELSCLHGGAKLCVQAVIELRMVLHKPARPFRGENLHAVVRNSERKASNTRRVAISACCWMGTAHIDTPVTDRYPDNPTGGTHGLCGAVRGRDSGILRSLKLWHDAEEGDNEAWTFPAQSSQLFWPARETQVMFPGSWAAKGHKQCLKDKIRFLRCQ